jgi:CxxC-x17-CxxC domain-containing protein
MGRASSKRRRANTIRKLQEVAGVDTGLAAHMYDRQVMPQRRAAELREQGVDAEVAFVNTSADAQGFKVKCYGCGRKATLPFEPPAGKGVLCPDCQRG